MNTHVARAPRAQASLSKDNATDALYSKVSWRIIPLLIVCYIVAYLDRINIGYAQLQMKQVLTFSDAVYGLGAGIFFIGYFLFEVPSNLMLEKIGARKTLLRIMFCWGIVAAAMMFVQTPTQFYVLRFLLGVFEAGFFPGIILYLTYWYPSKRRGQMIAIFMAATTVASVIAGPLCGGIMKYMDGANGLAGWQWLFLVQGLPASLLGIVAYFYLQDKPEDARWLSAAEKKALRTNLENDHGNVAGASHASLGQMFRDRKVYVLALVYFLLLGATYTMIFWVPTLIKSWGVADLMQIGLYSALPSLIGVFGMILIGRNSDKHGERRWHFAGSVAIAAIGLGITTLTQGNLGCIARRLVAGGDRHRRSNAAVLHDHDRVFVEGRSRRRHCADQQPGQPGCRSEPRGHRCDQCANRQPGLQHVPGDGAVSAVGNDPAAGGALGEGAEERPGLNPTPHTTETSTWTT